jgi:hypothetical protein
MRLVGRSIHDSPWQRYAPRSKPDNHRATAFTIPIAECSCAAEPYRRVLTDHGLIGSMSRRGNPGSAPERTPRRHD